MIIKVYFNRKFVITGIGNFLVRLYKAIVYEIQMNNMSCSGSEDYRTKL